MTKVSNNPAAPEWLRPPGEQEGLSYYVEVLRERIRIVVAIVLITLVAAGAYLLTAEKVYESEARLLITAAASDDPLAASLGLPRSSSDPTRDIETIATLATSLEVATRAREQLGLDAPASSLKGKVTAAPLASSNLVSITAEGSTAAEAADLANAFAVGLVDDRSETLHSEVDALVRQLKTQLKSGSEAGLSLDSTLQSDITRLEALRSRPDPTLRLETEAVPATAPVSPKPVLTMAGALLAGFVLGIAAAFAAQALDPRLRREEQLRARYRLPILARVPREPGAKGRPMGPAALSLPTKEAYRALRANVTAARRTPWAPHSVLVTGSQPSEGKTTTSINLAASLALAGNQVILIEADLRRPAIARALGLEVEFGVVGTMLENVSIDDALITTAAFGPSLKLLLADYEGGMMAELFSPHAAERLLAAAKLRADYVIVDSPPLTTVVDTLPLARQVDEVIVVARLGVTRLDKLPELAELLASNDITPLGFALIGTDRIQSGYYYHQEAEEERPVNWPEPAGRDNSGGEPTPARRVAHPSKPRSRPSRREGP